MTFSRWRTGTGLSGLSSSALLCVRSSASLPRFSAGSRPGTPRSLRCRTNRYHRVILFGTFDVVVTDVCAAFDAPPPIPIFRTSPARKRLWHPARQPAGRRAPFPDDTVNKSRAPCPAEDFAVTHHTSPLIPFLPRKLTCPLIGI